MGRTLGAEKTRQKRLAKLWKRALRYNERVRTPKTLFPGTCNGQRTALRALLPVGLPKVLGQHT